MPKNVMAITYGPRPFRLTRTEEHALDQQENGVNGQIGR
jgi:hypothetical protein